MINESVILKKMDEIERLIRNHPGYDSIPRLRTSRWIAEHVFGCETPGDLKRCMDNLILHHKRKNIPAKQMGSAYMFDPRDFTPEMIKTIQKKSGKSRTTMFNKAGIT